MKIKKLNGIVGTILFEPNTLTYSPTPETILRESLLAIDVPPRHILNMIDEFIFVFDTIEDSITFIIIFLRITLNHASTGNQKLSIRSGVCQGEYFLSKDQIYGNAINLATKLSYLSRDDEVLVDKIQSESIEYLSTIHADAVFSEGQQNKDYTSIALIDADATRIKNSSLTISIRYNEKSASLNMADHEKITIGRSDQSDIPIDSEHISRFHASFILKNKAIFLEDHSVNGTHVSIDGVDFHLKRESIKLSKRGYIRCGRSLDLNTKQKHQEDTISYLIGEN